MLLKQDLIGKIKDYFDLNIYETKVWLALLGKGIASAGEVASISRVPRSRTYDVLESLEKKEVIICTNVMEIISKIKLFQKTVEQLKKANVDIKFALSGDEKLVKQIETKLDVKIKFVNIDAKFFIVDRTEILFYISKDSDIAIWLNSDFFSQAFAELFDKVMKS